jgi:hypothetical protein
MVEAPSKEQAQSTADALAARVRAHPEFAV